MFCDFKDPVSERTPGDSEKIPLNFKLQLLSDHFGILLTRSSRQERSDYPGAGNFSSSSLGGEAVVTQ